MTGSGSEPTHVTADLVSATRLITTIYAARSYAEAGPRRDVLAGYFARAARMVVPELELLVRGGGVAHTDVSLPVWCAREAQVLLDTFVDHLEADWSVAGSVMGDAAELDDTLCAARADLAWLRSLLP